MTNAATYAMRAEFFLDNITPESKDAVSLATIALAWLEMAKWKEAHGDDSAKQ